MIFWFIYAL